MSRPARILCALLALVLAGCEVRLRRADMPDPPPAGWAELGLNPAYHVKRFDDLAALERYCRANNVSANDAYNKHGLLACVIPGEREVVLPTEGLLRDPAREDALTRHEYGHSWNLVHHDGKDWYYPDGRKAGPLSPAQAQMLASMARAQTLAEAPRGLMGSSARAAPAQGE